MTAPTTPLPLTSQNSNVFSRLWAYGTGGFAAILPPPTPTHDVQRRLALVSTLAEHNRSVVTRFAAMLITQAMRHRRSHYPITFTVPQVTACVIKTLTRKGYFTQFEKMLAEDRHLTLAIV